MNATTFIQWMEQGAALDKKSFALLDVFVKKYPYCQTARITRALFLFKNVANSGKEIQVTSIYTNNRAKLHFLLQKSTVKKEVLPNTTEKRAIVEDKIEVKPIETVTAEAKTEVKSIENPITKEVINEIKPEVIVKNEAPITKTIVESEKIKEVVTVEESKPKISITVEKDKQTLLREEIDKRLAEIAKEQQNKAPVSSNQHDELIEKFIQNEPKISPPKKDATVEMPDLSEKSAVDNVNLVSETLADIHFNQGNYQKALQIYENLILNNPEKSSYFAAQIEKINQLLNKK